MGKDFTRVEFPKQMIMTEQWKDISGYEGIYQVSNLGRVRNIKTNKLMKLNDNYGLYLLVGLSNNKHYKLCLVHRLVAQAFIPNPKNKREVNHLDGNKLNNRVDNLEWATRQENAKHSIRIGLQTKEQLDKAISSMLKKNKKPILQLKDGKVVARWESVRQVCRELHLTCSFICDCANGKCQTAYGYEWRYE